LSQLPSGRHEAAVNVRPLAADVIADRITGLDVAVEIKRMHPVVSVPSTLFFGQVKKDTIAKADVDLLWQLASDIEKRAQSPTCKHDLGKSLSVNIEHGTNGNWRLVGTLTPSQRGMINGSVVIDFGVTGVPPCVVPVSAYVLENVF
jgi:hypothetical protein